MVKNVETEDSEGVTVTIIIIDSIKMSFKVSVFVCTSPCMVRKRSDNEDRGPMPRKPPVGLNLRDCYCDDVQK